MSENWLQFFSYRFTVDVGNDGPGPGDMEIKGDFLNREYTFTRAGKHAATVSRKWFSFTDSYGVDVASGEDDILILACAVVVDMCTEKHQNHSK